MVLELKKVSVKLKLGPGETESKGRRESNKKSFIILNNPLTHFYSSSYKFNQSVDPHVRIIGLPVNVMKAKDRVLAVLDSRVSIILSLKFQTNFTRIISLQSNVWCPFYSYPFCVCFFFNWKGLPCDYENGYLIHWPFVYYRTWWE